MTFEVIYSCSAANMWKDHVKKYPFLTKSFPIQDDIAPQTKINCWPIVKCALFNKPKLRYDGRLEWKASNVRV